MWMAHEVREPVWPLGHELCRACVGGACASRRGGARRGMLPWSWVVIAGVGEDTASKPATGLNRS